MAPHFLFLLLTCFGPPWTLAFLLPHSPPAQIRSGDSCLPLASPGSALRVIGHAVAQFEQTVRKALKDRIALARCSHGLHQVRCGEEGTPVSSAATPPGSPTAHPPECGVALPQ
ncbi:hypothetical protein MC885_018436 [Smutsia gigantea]|nr:hypothetical protein MC885_018436 [Smutsia gigantea]